MQKRWKLNQNNTSKVDSFFTADRNSFKKAMSRNDSLNKDKYLWSQLRKKANKSMLNRNEGDKIFTSSGLWSPNSMLDSFSQQNYWTNVLFLK